MSPFDINTGSTRDIVTNAINEDDATCVEPTSVLSSVASEPSQRFSEKQTCDPMIEQKVKTTLEAAMGTALQDLAGPVNNPQDVQERVTAEAASNEEKAQRR